jgi:hypothetical protein
MGRKEGNLAVLMKKREEEEEEPRENNPFVGTR